MEHASYQKINEGLEKLGLTEPSARQINQAEWIVTEKIHGANFCVILDADHIECAKRKALISPTEHFFGHRRVVATIRGVLRDLFALLAAEHQELERVFLYGELYGGAYPHEEVAPVEDVEPVQTGVYYCPEVRFCGFDLALSVGGEPMRFLDFDEAARACERVGASFIEVLARGSLKEALAYPLSFDSSVPAFLGLPALDRPNLVEGVVLRPAKEMQVETTSKGKIRPFIKRKADIFAEDARFHAARDWSKERSSPAKSWGMDRLEWELASRLTPPRVQAAISKIGRPESRGDDLAEEVLDEVARDLFEEIDEVCGEALLAITSEEYRLLRGVMREEARELL